MNGGSSRLPAVALAAALSAAFAAAPGRADERLAPVPPMLRLTSAIHATIGREDPGFDAHLRILPRVSTPSAPGRPLRSIRLLAQAPAATSIRPLNCGALPSHFVSGSGDLLPRGAALPLPAIPPGNASSAASPLRGAALALPVVGMAQARARLVAAKLVLDSLLDGSLDAKSPEWRPHLAWLMETPEAGAAPEVVFSLLLTGCEGVDDGARMTVAENWARRHDGGRFSGAVAYACARHLFNSGLYDQAAARCVAIAQADAAFAVRAMLLKILSEAYAGDLALAKRTLGEAKSRHADSPEMPELRYLEAWIALQEMRLVEAKAILGAIVRDTPAAPAAAKATQVLESLESSP